MRWSTAAAVLCMAMACASTVGADGTPRDKSAADQDQSIYKASGGVFAPQLGVTAATPVKEKDNSGVAPFSSAREPVGASGERVIPDRPANITRSDNGSMFRVELSSVPEPALLTPGEQASGDAVATRGGGCGDPESGSCCEANYTPYCDDSECCEMVCYMYGFSWCCDEEGGGWDETCAEIAQEACGDVCGPPTAACCFDDECAEMERMDCELAGGSWFHGAHCASFECPGCSPEDSLFSQSVHDWGTFYGTNSDLDSGYSIAYDRFWDVQGDICGVSWVGTPQDEMGWECYEDPMTFEITFYEDDGGVPGAEVCAYTYAVSGTPFGDYWWFQYEVELDTCCTLENGFISIAGTGGPDCRFGWIQGVNGDGTHCSWDSEEGEWNCPPPGQDWSFDVNFCLLGTPYPGACCDEVGGGCQDGIEAVDCPATSRFAPATLCDDMDPPCGTLAGACCIDEPPYCYHEAGANCEGTYLGDGTECDPNDCNENGVPDSCDIAGGYSEDCDGNGVPDECDIAGGADDYDGNGVLDACEPDCNGNGVVDACDISCAPGTCDDHPGGCGISLDCQPNGVPDECELGTLGSPTLWDNGAPNDTWALRSHFGGDYDDALTVDDINLPDGGVINGLHWEVEDTGLFDWQGFVHVFIYGDNGAGAPDDSNEITYFTVPGDGGTIVKTWLGPGALYENRYRYDIYGLDIPLDPGIYWIGLAPDGGETEYGSGAASRWCTSQTGSAVIGGEAHIRVPMIGMNFFIPWSDQGAPGPHDAAFTVSTTVFGADCDGNNNPDDCDIAECDGSAWCQDCQGNGIPDGCEPDCNANGVADQCDILDCDGSTWCTDCDGNEVPDECQVPPIGGEPDCNENGSPDTCDIADGVSPDCNGNGIPDECDVASGYSNDYDGNGIPDDCDPDCNGNGVVDACDISCGTGTCYDHPDGCGISDDCQPDGIPDECQLFTAWDYIIDDGSQDNSTGLTSGGTIAWLNQFVIQDDITTISAIKLAWGNVPAGTACTVYLWSDPNNDGTPNDAVVLASAATTVAAPDTSTYTTVDITDTYVGPNGTSFYVGAIMSHVAGDHPAPLDSNGWGTGWIAGNTAGGIDPNNLAAAPVAPQPYSNAWLVRAVGMNDNDCNDNEVPDECDIASGASEDCDANGMPDECEWLDCNSNGVHDPCDLLTCDGSPWCSDCNLNGVPDDCDIASGFSADCHPDGVPDECQLGGLVTLLEETFYTTSWWEEPVPNGWGSVTVAGAPWNEWIMYGGWGCDYEGGAVIWGNMGEGKSQTGGESLDVYLLSPELTGTEGILSLCTNGCAYGAEPWCDEELDVVIVVGEVGGGDDIYVGSISDAWTGYYGSFEELEFDLNGLLPSGPYHIAFRYHGEGTMYENAMVDQVLLTKDQPGSDCNDNEIPDFCDLRDCDGSPWCDDCNGDEILDGCQTGQPGGQRYQYDDGSTEGTLGAGELAEMVWIQGFVAVPGSETIVSVSTCFGTPYSPGGSGVLPGDPFRVFVWDDPNDDGDPADAVLLASATAFVDAGSIDTDVLQKVTIDPVDVSGSFFIGAAVLSEMYPAPMDAEGTSLTDSWVTLGWPDEGRLRPEHDHVGRQHECHRVCVRLAPAGRQSTRARSERLQRQRRPG